jgi:hypothetical protein
MVCRNTHKVNDQGGAIGGMGSLGKERILRRKEIFLLPMVNPLIAYLVLISD